MPTDEIRREQLIDGRQVAPAPHRIVLAQYHVFRIHPPSSALNATPSAIAARTGSETCSAARLS
jgi:hypothetical protein